MRCFLAFASVSLAFVLLLSAAGSAQQPVTIHVDAGKTQGQFAPVWAYFGYDEPNYTYAEHGRELIGELAALSPAPVHIRVHNLLTTGDGTPALKWGSTNAYSEDASGNPIYDWKILDRILDTYAEAGVEPFIELGFMPEALSTHPEPYRHDWPKGELYTGWAYPPKDYHKWADLVYQFARHCSERYGRAKAEGWYWEVWNEPNIGYWHGTPEQYNEFYDYSAEAVKRALPAARVGGPATTGPSGERAAAFLRQFLEHCARGQNYATGKTGTSLDFISFHAKGAPKLVDGRVQMGLANNLRDAADGFAIIASFPEFARLPVVLSESDPEGCAACSARGYPQNAYRNGALYPAYTATAIRNILDLAARSGINLQGFLTWAFEFEGQPYFEGFRTLATNAVDKPILNLFRMLGRMQGERVAAESSGSASAGQILKAGVREAPDIDVMAARSARSLAVLLWNYHDDDATAPDSTVTLTIAGLPRARRLLLRHYRIDRDHSNAFTLWKQIGSPQAPTPEQYKQLRAAGHLQLLEPERQLRSKGGELQLDFALPRQALSLVEISWR